MVGIAHPEPPNEFMLSAPRQITLLPLQN